MEGRGTMLVTAVGPNSQQGRIFALMRGIEEESGQSGLSGFNNTNMMYRITLKFGAREIKDLCFITKPPLNLPSFSLDLLSIYT